MILNERKELSVILYLSTKKAINSIQCAFLLFEFFTATRVAREVMRSLIHSQNSRCSGLRRSRPVSSFAIESFDGVVRSHRLESRDVRKTVRLWSCWLIWLAMLKEIRQPCVVRNFSGSGQLMIVEKIIEIALIEIKS